MTRAQPPKLLGIAASLRNARWGAGNRHLIEQLSALEDKKALFAFLQRESELHLESFVEAGRRDGKNFLEIYANLKKSNGEAGLSNSEVALAAALWSAHAEGVEVAHLSLAEHFTAGGEVRQPERLRAQLLEADGILVSGPVYFGDRGSLAETLIEFIGRDRALREAMKDRLYGGIAVGAKRNGGQETTLIYQMIDMMRLGLLAVGNDSETTAQYGGTGHAGDVGTMHKDVYGLETSMGVGRRMARVLTALSGNDTLVEPVKALFLVLQDADGLAMREVQALAGRFSARIAGTIVDVANKSIKRCIACDICPTHIDVDDVYRCIIKSSTDDLDGLHDGLLYHDLIVPVVGTVSDRSRVVGNYQTFVERTRYLRRGDYVWTDAVVAPLAVAELDGFDTHPLRMMTSFLRHHTVMTKPILGHVVDDAVINRDQMEAQFDVAITAANRLAAGRLSRFDANVASRYNPVGYVLSANKELEDQRLDTRREMIEARRHRLRDAAAKRISFGG
jgi:multimeric flavodoxin WrbA